MTLVWTLDETFVFFWHIVVTRRYDRISIILLRFFLKIIFSQIITHKGDLSPQWQTKLVSYEYDYNQGFLDAVEVEVLFLSSPFYNPIDDSKNVFQDYFTKLYVQYSANQTAQTLDQVFTRLATENICDVDIFNI